MELRCQGLGLRVSGLGYTKHWPVFAPRLTAGLRHLILH